MTKCLELCGTVFNLRILQSEFLRVLEREGRDKVAEEQEYGKQF